MERIPDLLAAGQTRSVEFFPPKTADGIAQLHRTIGELSAIDLSFVSVTYGAGGSTRDLTRDLVIGINEANPFPAMPHLTCIGHTTAELESLIDDYVANGVTNVLALAGDPPVDGSPAVGDFTYASELVDLVRSRSDMAVAVAAFPEVHPRSADRGSDRRALAAKLESADFGITTFFFDPDGYFRMVDELAELGCDTPILPGIVEVLNPTTTRRFSDMNGTHFPEELAIRIDEATEADRHKIIVEVSVDICERLLAGGVPGLHFYCLNRAETTLDIAAALGM